MLKAINNNNNPIYAWEANRSSKFYCPECEQEVMLKRGFVKIAHFAHLPGNSCPYSEGESWEHLQMKENLIRSLRKGYSDDQIDTELSIVKGRRADVVLKLPRDSLVIECQVSPITVNDLRQRTMDYLNAGYNIQWVFHLNRIKRNTFYDRIGAVRIPEEIRFLDTKKMPLYFMDDNGKIRACELKYKWAKGSMMAGCEATCFCNFKRVRLWEFIGGFPA